ncbi:nicotinate-nucleotide pyrophosphorylase [Ruminiclostridium papyrosolvens DSM 2782]|uniref:Probable nicotinate-nucleotide pyrophosphorylase [carboxylating] n=1 Tax=Ruminiclostridium papyrosolvens DSM 2782 TaxID=588581 RepID=F1TFH5_9FIRM|nr:carboxylating nicotinate-nucleotide diphosphorylase [Ruminiclostridium papyrosolvens]EGD46899.1 nicotinate-nucleotide pyrophosphorylase [Ruminiclostridium papyrosolvens DSM 2782]WES34381.1 carboxylating nicotinate-nucleotide diphosphorylase [Ruminiclostridium papyrosolvens DSM 2782]
MKLSKLYIHEIVMNALKEDMPLGDITTDNIISEGDSSKAEFLAKQDAVIVGLDVAKYVFEVLDGDVCFKAFVKDGDKVSKGDIIAEVSGPTRALLKGERTALNFMQRLSAVATMTNRYVSKVQGLPVKVTDTRKTTPGMRLLEKYAVNAGGGANHRFSLSDGVLIKDNHIAAAGGIRNAVERVRSSIPHTVKIEVEVESMEEVREALECKADIIMLDNMSNEQMTEAVKFIDKRALVEASGNISEETIYNVALTGVDIISIGKLTHSANSVDISMNIE